MKACSLIRTIGATILLALAAPGKAGAQGLEEHILLFRVSGIDGTLTEKRCEEALLAFDPAMVVSIDRQKGMVKVKTMHEIPRTALTDALRSVGLVVELDRPVDQK